MTSPKKRKKPCQKHFLKTEMLQGKDHSVSKYLWWYWEPWAGDEHELGESLQNTMLPLWQHMVKERTFTLHAADTKCPELSELLQCCSAGWGSEEVCESLFEQRLKPWVMPKLQDWCALQGTTVLCENGIQIVTKSEANLPAKHNSRVIFPAYSP